MNNLAAFLLYRSELDAITRAIHPQLFSEFDFRPLEQLFAFGRFSFRDRPCSSILVLEKRSTPGCTRRTSILCALRRNMSNPALVFAAIEEIYR